MASAIREFSGSLDAGLSLQIAQVDQDAANAQERMYQLVGEILVKIGEHIQTLRFEKLELAKENAALTQQTAQLKLMHEAEWDAVREDFIGKMGVVSDKLKAIVERFEWLKESLIDARGEQFLANVRNLDPNGGTLQGYYRASGMVGIRSQFDACLAYEGCESVNADWLQVTVYDGRCGGELRYPGYARRDVTAVPVQESASAARGVIPQPDDLMVRKFTQVHVEKYQALEAETAAMRAGNSVLQAEKDRMVEVHPANLRSEKSLFAVKFMENLQKARRQYAHYEKMMHHTDQFIGISDPRFASRPLEGVYLQWVQEGYVEEAKRIQGLMAPLIPMLEGFIVEYGGKPCQ